MARTRQRARIVAEVTRRMLAAPERTGAPASPDVEALVRAHADEIHSDFNPLLYELTAASLPWLLHPLLARATPGSLLRGIFLRRERMRRLILTGDATLPRELARRGTLIVVPMHASHLDSVAVGLALRHQGLPRVLYGAGLNLFRNPVLAFLLSSFGAYKVDRRKKDALYKEALKQYVTFSLEKGKHNLFFPGGTRSRDGAVEQRLKLGLLGCGITAYVSGLRNNRPRPDIFVLPVALSHAIVPEAEFLTAGSPDEEPPPGLANRLREALRLESRVHMHLCAPLDVFGNAVDGESLSRDAAGNATDRRALVSRNGEPVADRERDTAATRALGDAVARAWLREAPILCTHVAAYALSEALRESGVPGDDVAGMAKPVPFDTVLAKLSETLRALRAARRNGTLRLEEFLETAGPEEAFGAAHILFDGAHGGKVVHIEGGKACTRHPKLLNFYAARVRQREDIDLRPASDGAAERIA